MNDKKDKKEIEKTILKEIENTKIKVLELKELTMPIAPDTSIGRISRMDAINNKSINEAALRKAENKLKGLKIALQNINDVGFGKCARCNNDIPMGRILIMPHSRFCVHCAS